jgi:AmiR/NasT family two-component response regulator
VTRPTQQSLADLVAHISTGLPPSGNYASPDTSAVRAEEELQVLHQQVAHLHAALLSRGAIDQAKGILIARYGISPDRAFDVLVRWSQHRNIKVRIIAETLVTITQSGSPAPAADPILGSWLHKQVTRPASDHVP